MGVNGVFTDLDVATVAELLNAGLFRQDKSECITIVDHDRRLSISFTHKWKAELWNFLA
jgi:hypothetical protein